MSQNSSGKKDRGRKIIGKTIEIRTRMMEMGKKEDTMKIGNSLTIESLDNIIDRKMIDQGMKDKIDLAGKIDLIDKKKKEIQNTKGSQDSKEGQDHKEVMSVMKEKKTGAMKAEPLKIMKTLQRNTNRNSQMKP